MRHAHVRTSLLVVGALGGLLALAGCGLPTVPITSTHASVGPTPTVIHAQTAIHTADAAPPWTGLPLRTRTSAGTPGDPVNVAFEGSKSTIVAAFKKIGWVRADPLSVENDVRLAKDTLTHRSYPRAPVSTLYLSGRPQDFAVEKEVGTVAQRDHARLWDTHRTDAKTHLELWIANAARHQDRGRAQARRAGRHDPSHRPRR